MQRNVTFTDSEFNALCTNLDDLKLYVKQISTKCTDDSIIDDLFYVENTLSNILVNLS